MVRKINPGDMPLLAGWMAGDPWHRGVLEPEFFMQPITIAVGDEIEPQMFIRLVAEPPMMRMYIQFSPDEKRVARALLENFGQVRELVKSTGAAGMVYDSISPRLIRFCARAWGFQRVGETDDYQILFERAS